MMFNGLEVDANADGTFSLSMPPTGERKTYHEISPFLWREVDGKGLVEARVMDGRVTSLHFDPIDVLLKVPFWQSAKFNVPLLIASILAMLVSLLSWPIVAWARHHYRLSAVLTLRETRSYRLSRLGMLAMVLFLCGWLFLTMNLLSHFYLFNAALDPWIRVLHLLGVFGVTGVGLVVWNAWVIWRARRNWWMRLWNVLTATLMAWLTWFIFSFNLISLSLNY